MEDQYQEPDNEWQVRHLHPNDPLFTGGSEPGPGGSESGAARSGRDAARSEHEAPPENDAPHANDGPPGDDHDPLPPTQEPEDGLL
jgi:hypothetical protein